MGIGVFKGVGMLAGGLVSGESGIVDTLVYIWRELGLVSGAGNGSVIGWFGP